MDDEPFDWAKFLVNRGRVAELLRKEEQNDQLAEVWGRLRIIQQSENGDSSAEEQQLAELLDVLIGRGE